MIDIIQKRSLLAQSTIMNVLGKLKSKKLKTDQNSKEQAETSKTQSLGPVERQETKFFKYSQVVPPLQSIKKHKSNLFKTPVVETQFIQNTNIISKRKEVAIRENDLGLMIRPNTLSNNNFSTFLNLNFHSKKESKKVGVYFDEIPSVRTNSLCFNEVTKIGKQNQSVQIDDTFAMDFDFLLSNKEKRQIKKSLHLSRGKAQNIKEIEIGLKKQNNEVFCFLMKNWYLYGDIYMFEGELQSLKRGYIEIDLQGKTKKISGLTMVKMSCGRDSIISPETIGRIYLSQVVFLTQNQVMFCQEAILKTIQKSRKRREN